MILTLQWKTIPPPLQSFSTLNQVHSLACYFHRPPSYPPAVIRPSPITTFSASSDSPHINTVLPMNVYQFLYLRPLIADCFSCHGVISRPHITITPSLRSNASDTSLQTSTITDVVFTNHCFLSRCGVSLLRCHLTHGVQTRVKVRQQQLDPPVYSPRRYQYIPTLQASHTSTSYASLADVILSV